ECALHIIQQYESCDSEIAERFKSGVQYSCFFWYGSYYGDGVSVREAQRPEADGGITECSRHASSTLHSLT
ncbi:hypothetical protein HAX54_036496, partial [Datura stramonium]|nr:hypothetical protein [Datura stramonium]